MGITGLPQIFRESQHPVILGILELESAQFSVLFSDQNYPTLLWEMLTILLLFPYLQFSVLNNIPYSSIYHLRR